MVIEKFEESPTDEVFRKYVRDLIDSAKEEIFVIAGEVGSYRFLDLKLAAERASERGVKIHVYATHPPQEIVNGLLVRGCEVYVGEEVEDHYIVADSNSWILSKSHPPGKIGTRRGEVHWDEIESAKKVINNFYRLASRGQKKTRIEWDKDPLWVALESPPDWGVETDSSRLKEELF